MSSPGTRFAVWMVLTGQRQAAVAALLGCHGSQLSHIRHGRRKPSRRLAAAIERATKDWDQGPIAVAEWDAEAEAA